MIDWVTEHADKIGGFFVALAGVIGAAWMAILKGRVKTAQTGADVAIAQSQGEVFAQMKERLTDLAGQVERLTQNVDQLREQIRERDNKIHALEMHIRDLEHIMRDKGLQPPPFRA